MTYLRAVFATAVIALAMPGRAAGAQEVRQETRVVVTAATVPVEIATVSRAVAVLTRDDIARLPARSVADLLRLLASVDVRARGDRGMQTDFAVRGAGFGGALVLVDGVRLNDAQSGHHNGDIPVPLEAIERIEILQGIGSSLFGADAFGGTINIITRREAPGSAAIEAGSFDLLSGRGQTTFRKGRVAQLVSGEAARSTGFMYERQFETVDLLARTSIGSRSSVSASYLWKDFGANGFYGAAPSHEWTNQTRLALDQRLGAFAGWEVGAVASYRTHGDRFLFNVERPGVSENVHRSHALIGSVKASRAAGGRTVTAGIEAGGDWIRSTNLQNHATQRVSVFGELRQPLASRTYVDASVRFDRYDEFGRTVNPAAGVAWWPARVVRVRGSVGRAFRVPTFTERYYSDPANLARADVGPETTWGGEGGVDLFVPDAALTVAATVFGRRDRDVIDWLRATPADRWRTYNVHRVTTAGVELSARRAFGDGFVQVGYTGLSVEPDTLSTLCGAPSCLSKYVLEYAPHSATAAALVPLPFGLRIAPRFEYRHRRRNTLATDYAIVDLRVSRGFGRYEIRVDGSNVGDTSYQEIAGVAMPGRAATVTLAVR